MNLTTQVTIFFLSKIPIKLKEVSQKNTSKYVEKILLLEEQLNEIGKLKTDKSFKLEKEIKELNTKIDKEVYNSYNLTKSEIKLIEESLKK